MLKEIKQTLSSFHGHITHCLIGSPLTNKLKSICLQNTLVNFRNLPNSLSQHRKIFEDFSSTLGQLRKSLEDFRNLLPFSRCKVKVNIGRSS